MKAVAGVLFSVVTLVLNATAFGQRIEPKFELKDDLGAYVALRAAANDYIRASAESELRRSETALNRARTEAERANTALTWQQVRNLELDIQEKRRRLARNEADEVRRRRELQELEYHSEVVKALHFGITNRFVFESLDYFLMNVVPTGTTASVMFLSVDSLSAEDFLANDRVSPTKLFDGGGNLGQLIDFMRDNDFSARRWTAAHGLLLSMIDLLSVPARERIDEISQDMDALANDEF